MDSGASDHVSSRLDLPGHEVVPSAGGRAGRHYTSAGGTPIANEGESRVVMELPNGEGGTNGGNCMFQIADVTRPLMSVSKLCENGNYDVLCRRDQACILDREHNVVAAFERKNGLYVADLVAKNPKHPGFVGPA